MRPKKLKYFILTLIYFIQYNNKKEKGGNMEDQGLVFAPDAGLSRLKWEYERERTGYDDLLAFGTADMDYASPAPILCALRSVIDRGHLGY